MEILSSINRLLFIRHILLICVSALINICVTIIVFKALASNMYMPTYIYIDIHVPIMTLYFKIYVYNR